MRKHKVRYSYVLMEYTPNKLRTSARFTYQNIFKDVRLENFIDFAGYTLSSHANSVEKRAEALANYANSPSSTIRRWITGESQPNGTNTLLIYGALLAYSFDGDQEAMLFNFLKWHDRSLLGKYFLLSEGDEFPKFT